MSESTACSIKVHLNQHRSKWMKGVVRRLLAVSITVAVPSVCLPFLFSLPENVVPPSFNNAGIVISVVVAVSAILLIAWRWALDVDIRCTRELSKAIKDCTELRDLPQLVTLLSSCDRTIRFSAAQSLRCLLDASDSATLRSLSSSHCRTLERQLTGRDFNLTLSLLRAVSRTGDLRYLNVLERMEKADARFALEKEIKKEACSTAESIRARQNRSSETLLRPSEIPTQQDALLRPAAVSEDRVSEELLRASR